MQNDTIINALSEKIERLEAENAHLKTQSVENALNKILGISSESIVNFDPENTSVFNRYSLVAMENLGEMKNNLLTLKDKNERLEKWDKEHREKIALLEKEVNTQVLALKAFNEICDKIPRWKNSVKDGLPDLDSDPAAVITICGGIIFMHHTMEDEDMEKLNNFDTEYYYFLVPRVGFDKIKKDATN